MVFGSGRKQDWALKVLLRFCMSNLSTLQTDNLTSMPLKCLEYILHCVVYCMTKVMDSVKSAGREISLFTEQKDQEDRTVAMACLLQSCRKSC